MRLSRSTGYGILAVGYIAKHQNKPIILSQEVAKEYNIPLEYLLKIMQQLVRANILRSKRGPRGGFSLAKPISKISFLQVVEAVEGPLVSQLGLSELAPREKFGIKAEKVYEKALASAKGIFEKTKISQIM